VTAPSSRFTDHMRHSAWLIWFVGVGVYFLGVMHRASLGVAGPQAIQRLEISSTELGSFIMVQLGLYAVMQVPSGLLIDRFGPRKMLLAATLLMGSAQVLFAFATNFPTALVARGLLGVGDSAVFIAVLRLAAVWFPRRRYAVLTMATGLAGMSGNLVATVPLVLALGEFGWTPTFTVTGLMSVAYALLLLRPAVAARNRPGQPAAKGSSKPAAPAGKHPGGQEQDDPQEDSQEQPATNQPGARMESPVRQQPGATQERLSSEQRPGAQQRLGAEEQSAAAKQPAAQQSQRRSAMSNARAAWGQRETRLGFWTHQGTMTAGTVLSLVWGYPYLTEGLDYSSQAAAGQLSVYVVANLVASFLVGPLAGRKPEWRTAMALGISLACMVAVGALAVWPGGGPPPAVVTAVFIIIALGPPGSQIGFHLARDYNPPTWISTATGLVNAGGFAGSMIVAILVGIVLDISSGGAANTLMDYRWAMGSIAAAGLVSTTAMVLVLLRVRSTVLERLSRKEDVIVQVTERPWDRMFRGERPRG